MTFAAVKHRLWIAFCWKVHRLMNHVYLDSSVTDNAAQEIQSVGHLAHHSIQITSQVDVRKVA